MSYDLKNLPIISSGLTDSSIVFGAKDGQSDDDPDPINLSALWDYVLDKMESAQADAQTALGITELVESAAESAATAAEAAEVASGAMTALLNPIFSTVATAKAYSPDAAPDYIRTAFYDGDFVIGSGATYRKVDTEPSHAGKFSITLSDGNTVVWYEIAEAEVHIAQFGAKMDGVTDDAQAVLDAHSVGRPVRFGPGTIRLASMISVANTNITWLGTGKRGTGSGTTIFADHSDAGVLKIIGGTHTTAVRIADIQIKADTTAPPNDQHGIIVAGRLSAASLERLVFADLTGYAIAWDPTATQSVNYAQNVALRDIGFFNVGGCLGLTQEPDASQSYLACTLLQIHNVNLDVGINSQSPQPYIWDFRPFREISADTFLCEGNVPVGGPDVVMAFCTNAQNTFNNMHFEWGVARPTYIAYFFDDPDEKFYSQTQSFNVFRSFNGAGKFGIDARVETDIHVIDWEFYHAASIDDILYLGGYGGSIIFEGLRVKGAISVPIHMAGQVEIKSQRSMDRYMPLLERGPTKIASWRPSDGSLASFNATHMDPFVGGFDSNAVEEDDQNDRLQVWRATNAGGTATANFNATLVVPYDWFDVYLDYDAQTAEFTVGSILTGGTSGAKARIVAVDDDDDTGTLRLKMLTADDFEDDETITDADGGSATADGDPRKIGPVITGVMRYRVTIDPTDEATGVRARIAGPSTGVVSTVYQLGGQAPNNEWDTVVVSARLTQGGIRPFLSMGLEGGTPTNDVVFRIAAIDFYLGRHWQEPLDLSYV